jgi:hypothetical protein
MFMGTNLVFLGWNRPVAGREAQAGQLFQETLQYLGGLQQAGTIQSFDTVLLNPHGGDLNGFFLIRGESTKLDALKSSEKWQTFMTRAGMLLEGVGAVRGATGEMVMEWMNRWNNLISS